MIGGMLSQNILNLVDTLMIGQLGALALAGSGIGAFIYYVLFIGFIGLSSGVQTMVARFKGANTPALFSIPLMLGLAISITLAIGITLITLQISEGVTALFSNDSLVSTIGNDYLSTRILGLPFFAICLIIRGFWNGLSQPLRYLMVIMVIHATNILFNYMFIFGRFGAPEMGASGAGLASSLSLMLGAIIYLFDSRAFMNFNHSISQMRANGRWLANLSIPIAIQQIIHASGVLLLYWIIGQLGSNALAIGHVLINIALIAILPGVALGMTTMTLVSESLGNDQVQLAHQWPTHVHGIGKCMIGFFSLIVIGAPSLILRPFVSDPILLSLAVPLLRIDALTVFFEMGAIIYMHALTGADQTKVVAWGSTLLQWCLYLPLAYWTGVHLNLGMMGIWITTLMFQLLQWVIFKHLWKHRFHRFVQPQFTAK